MSKSRNIKASISLDDSRFNNSIKNINSSLKAINSSFATSKSEIDKLGVSTNSISKLQDSYKAKLDILRQKQEAYTKAIQKEQEVLQKNQQEHTKLEQSYNNQLQKINELIQIHGKNSTEVKKEEEVLKKLSIELQKNERDITNNKGKIDSYTTTINKSQTEINKAEKELNELGEGFNKAGKQASDTNNILKQFSVSNIVDGLSEVTSKLSGVFDSINSKIIGFGKSIFTSGMEYEKSMSQVQAVSGATEAEMEQLTQQSKKLGETTVKSSKEVSDSYKYMSMAGWDCNEMISAMPDVLNLSIASGEDMAQTCDIVTDSLTAFGLSADETSRFADVLASASSSANTNVSIMGESFKYVAPVAGSLKYSIEDTSLALGLMANAGIKGSQSGTALRAGLVNLVKPTDSMQNAMKKYGISIKDTNGKMLPFKNLMEQLRSKLGGLDEATKANVISTLFGKEAMSGWMSIVDASQKDFDKLSGAINNSSGKAKEMADVMGDNVYGKVEGLKSKIEALKSKAFEALYPVIEKVIQTLSDFLDKLNNMDEETMNNIITMAKYSLIIGGVLKGLNFLSGGIGGAIKMFTGFKGMVSTTGGILSKFTGGTALASKGATTLAGAGVKTAGSLAGKAGLLGGLKAVGAFLTGPWGLALAGGALAVGGLTLAVKKGREDCIKEVDLFADGLSQSQQKINSSNGNFTGQYVQTQVKITEATKSRLEQVMLLEEEHEKSLISARMRKKEITEAEMEEMKLLQQQLNNGVKEEDKKTIEERLALLQGKYNKEKELMKIEAENLQKQSVEINKLTLEKLDEKYNSEKQKLIDYLVNVQGLTAEDAKKQVEFMDINHNNTKKTMETQQAEYLALMKKSLEDKNGLSQEEYAKLMELEQQLKSGKIQALSETEIEAEVIQNRLKDKSLRLSSETMGGLIKDAENLRVKKIDEAIKQYEDYERILIQEKSRSNTLTDEKYKEMLERASKGRDERVLLANEEKIGVLKELEEMNKGAYDGIDRNTGEILGGWKTFWGGMNDSTEENANKSITKMNELRGNIDKLPDYQKKVIEIQTVETKITKNSYQGGGNASNNGHVGRNRYGIYSNITPESLNLEKTVSEMNNVGLIELKNTLNNLNNNFNNLIQNINKIPDSLDSLKDNFTIINENNIKIDKNALINTVDKGLYENTSTNNIFNGKRRK